MSIIKWLLSLVLTTAALSAQVPATPATFEVASVRQNTSGDLGGSYDTSPGSQLVIRNYSLRDIILNTYGVQGESLRGGPGWIASERFDIVAKPPEGVARSRDMMRALLADRFALRVHTETREIPIFRLVIARADRRLGPGLRAAAFDCATIRAARQRGETVPRPPSVGDGPFCGASQTPGRILASGYSMADVARNLTRASGRPVEDRTGITGMFDMVLSWTPDNPPPGAPVNPDGPSLFTAVEEQLGLKLDSAVSATQILVIDSVERPTPD